MSTPWPLRSSGDLSCVPKPRRALELAPYVHGFSASGGTASIDFKWSTSAFVAFEDTTYTGLSYEARGVKGTARLGQGEIRGPARRPRAQLRRGPRRFDNPQMLQEQVATATPCKDELKSDVASNFNRISARVVHWPTRQVRPFRYRLWWASSIGQQCVSICPLEKRDATSS
jgi:hypothetical protein